VSEVREELREPLRRTLGWLLSLRDERGRIVCPEHKLEHTGKSAGVAVLALELSRHEDRERLRAAALEQGRRLVANLVREGDSPCHTFRPGRHDPFNGSNAVIDGGAASDALAALVQGLADVLPAAERESFAAASLLHARTYLRYAVLDKGIPAQRAWGLTGLAAAHALEADPELERAALEAVGVLEGIQHADGSYPYHPLEWGAEHAGASDVSAFYQSRVSGFLMFALERLGRDPASALFAGPIRRGLDFLAALQGVDGIKVGLVEAKPWYWGATYEVASHPFDVYALARGGRLFGSPRLSTAALRAFRAWVDHLGADGRPASHRAGPGRGRSYQCPLFWAAHAEWIARALPDLEAALRAGHPRPEPRGGGIDLSVAWFPQAQVGRIEDGRVTAWVRGARPAYNVHHGSPHGAGLLRVQRRADGAELLERCRLGGAQEAEWSARAGLPSPARGWAGGGSEMRFALWLARVHWRAGRRGAALAAPLKVARRGVGAFASPRVSSAFALAPAVRVEGDGLELESELAWRGGASVPGSRLARRFQVDGDGLVVEERLLAAGAARGIGYGVPAAAREVVRAADRVSYRLA
jgi:hypothetical protein